MKKIFVIIAIAFFIISAVSCKKKEVEVSPPSGGDIAPDFTLKDINGNTISLADYKGKVIIVEFWATWCPPCKELTPVLAELYERYKNRGFIILSLASDDEDAVKSFAKKYEIPYPVLLADNETVRQYGVSSIPIGFTINKEGRVVNRHIGNTPGIMQELASEIERLL